MALTKVTGSMADAATESAPGVVELATEAEINTGTDTDRAVSPGRLKSALGFSDYFQSTSQTITFNGTLTIAHGLGRVPIFVSATIINVNGELDYTTGQEVCYALGGMDAAGNSGVSVIVDSTNLVVRFGSVLQTIHATTGAIGSITAANWTMRFRAWA